MVSYSTAIITVDEGMHWIRMGRCWGLIVVIWKEPSLEVTNDLTEFEIVVWTLINVICRNTKEEIAIKTTHTTGFVSPPPPPPKKKKIKSGNI